MASDCRIYCPLIPGLCGEAWDCEECVTFSDSMTSLGLEPTWVCPTCLPRGHLPSERTLLGFYQEGECDECHVTCVVLQAAVGHDKMTPTEWRETLREIRDEADTQEG